MMPQGATEQIEEVKEIQITVIESVVKLKQGLLWKDPCLNLKLQLKPYPRLWMTSTLESDNKENIYKGDILLFPNLKISLKAKECFEIFCPSSREKYIFTTAFATKWVNELNQIMISARLNEENHDHFLD
jgi:hypothetical protein